MRIESTDHVRQQVRGENGDQHRPGTRAGDELDVEAVPGAEAQPAIGGEGERPAVAA